MNNKVVVIDASSVFNILFALIREIEREHSNLTPTEKFNLSKNRVGFFLDRVRNCTSDGKLHISDKVFNDEINPKNPNSTLRSAARLNEFSRICQNNSNCFIEMSDVFKSIFTIIPISETDIQNLRGILSYSTGTKDLSILVLALSKSRGLNETILITDDESLKKVGLDVIQIRNISLFGISFTTDKIYPRGSLEFFELLHRCCELQSSDFEIFQNYMIEHDTSRPMMNDTWNMKSRTLTMVFKSYLESKREKDIINRIAP